MRTWASRLATNKLKTDTCKHLSLYVVVANYSTLVQCKMLIPYTVEEVNTSVDKNTHPTELFKRSYTDNSYNSAYLGDSSDDSGQVLGLAIGFGAFGLSFIGVMCYVRWQKKHSKKKLARLKALQEQEQLERKRRRAIKRTNTMISTTSIGNLGNPRKNNRVAVAVSHKPNAASDSSPSETQRENFPTSAPRVPVVQITEPPPAWTPLTRANTRVSPPSESPSRPASPVYPPAEPIRERFSFILPTYDQVRSETGTPVSLPPPVSSQQLMRSRMVDAEVPFTGWEQVQGDECLPTYERHETPP